MLVFVLVMVLGVGCWVFGDSGRLGRLGDDRNSWVLGVGCWCQRVLVVSVFGVSVSVSVSVSV